MAVFLKNPYICVSDGGLLSYGGNQMRSENKTERTVGCGVIAALDLLLYLARYHLDNADLGLHLPLPSSGPIPQANYQLFVHALRKRFVPLIPGHGINGLTLALGLNGFFFKNHFPFYTYWGVPYAKLWTTIREMLEADIPVVFSVGPNFPLFWQHHKLKFYTKSSGGDYIPGPQTHAHYVTVTGIDDEWLQIASWGRRYYIRREEYTAYVKEHSAKLVSNILVIRKRDRGGS